MKNVTLSKIQIQSLISNHRRRVDEEIVLNEDNKTILFEAVKQYGFEVDKRKVEQIFHSGNNSAPKDKKNNFSAILQIYGEYTVDSSVIIATESGREQVDLFICYVSLSNRENRELAKQLIEKNAVELFPGCDEEYLFEILSETTDQHFYETVKRFAHGIPIYEVVFKENGDFKVEELGKA